MTKPILTVTLNPALDVTILVERVKGSKGEKNYLPVETITAAGGKGVNVARALHAVRRPVMTTGFLGGETGTVLKRIISSERIQGNFQSVRGSTRVNYLVTDKEFKRNVREVQPGPSVSKIEQKKFFEKFGKLVSNSPLVCFSGSLPPGIEAQFYARLIREAQRKSIPTAFDSSGEAFRAGVEAKPDIIKPNLAEAEEYLGQRLKSRKVIRGAVAKFHSGGVGVVLLTLGPEGAVCSDGESCLHVKAPQRSVKSDVGCGDAFLAGFIADFTRGRAFSDCVKSACAAAAVSATQYVPGLVQYAAFMSMQRKVRITSL